MHVTSVSPCLFPPLILVLKSKEAVHLLGNLVGLEIADIEFDHTVFSLHEQKTTPTQTGGVFFLVSMMGTGFALLKIVMNNTYRVKLHASTTGLGLPIRRVAELDPYRSLGDKILRITRLPDGKVDDGGLCYPANTITRGRILDHCPVSECHGCYGVATDPWPEDIALIVKFGVNTRITVAFVVATVGSGIVFVLVERGGCVLSPS